MSFVFDAYDLNGEWEQSAMYSAFCVCVCVYDSCLVHIVLLRYGVWSLAYD